MSPALTRKQWVVVILVNIVISTVTALLIVRVLTAQPAAGGVGNTAIGRPAAAVSPTQTPPVPVVGNNARGPANDAAPAKPSPTPVPEATATKTPAASPTASATATGTPASRSLGNVGISTVLYAGQRQREVVVIANQGDQVNLKGWTLTSNKGITYTFGNVTLFKESFINLHTISGYDVPTDLFMNRSDAAWQVGDVLTLAAQGKTIATFTVKQQ